jgi:hypothetical protein
MNRSLAATSMALRIAAVPALFLFALRPPLGLAAAVTGAAAIVRDRRADGRAVAGIILGLVALAGAAVLIARPDS